LSALYPPESNHAEPLESLIGTDSAFYVCYFDSELVACVAVKIVRGATSYGEIKRLFVREESRGNGFATALVDRVEHHLKAEGIGVVRLEAGTQQPEALNLYQKLGYYCCDSFGSYRNDPLSVFMENHL
jgi:putative acetyltransferase